MDNFDPDRKTKDARSWILESGKDTIPRFDMIVGVPVVSDPPRDFKIPRNWVKDTRLGTLLKPESRTLLKGYLKQNEEEKKNQPLLL